MKFFMYSKKCDATPKEEIPSSAKIIEQTERITARQLETEWEKVIVAEQTKKSEEQPDNSPKTSVCYY